MLRIMLKSKIHRATVTEANLYYEGSITIDADLMKPADILENEKVEVLNLNNGQRIETYAIKGRPGSGVICLNGPAARGACPGDEVIILSYASVDCEGPGKMEPKIVRVDGKNRIKD
ncbi:MAG: aspartate 1-decarboxylase [Candidatus Omnitrophica bacterium]|jgi:aspartate 1-decarboxylase|nr:aspartate 1-decarboxylase [Candidatus Omnitrophota bacterium]MDD3987895.1 aspartate 1-decarboxylase [Candidatus Omnitrophota bacterium]MDD4982085.1 aspartate 1-decarboxylase [Candidatus Omnitrophota bacterium]MDD5665527.1 aspartate 1-decarboxylase [Candidatus Omnitrophota bacterium]